MKPYFRPRRLRENATLRRMVRETRLHADQLIYPMFVTEGEGIREPIPSMPGQFRWSVDTILEEVAEVSELGIPAVILFGIPEPEQKDARGSAAQASDGVICRALEALRHHLPEVLLIADVCLCEYTDHGHCGLPVQDPDGHTRIDNDFSVDLLASAALAYARAGAHMVAPSDMMDGRVAAIRERLDRHNFEHISIMSYAAKYASAFYGPFRDAAGSAPAFGDRRTYQMDPANFQEAIKETLLDVEEGADIVMVKPAMPYLDVVSEVRRSVHVPVAAYQVSGEYSALTAAFENGWLNRESTILESLTSISRAGAHLILTYFAKEAAHFIEGHKK